jgi:hypothetical protein
MKRPVILAALLVVVAGGALWRWTRGRSAGESSPPAKPAAGPTAPQPRPALPDPATLPPPAPPDLSRLPPLPAPHGDPAVQAALKDLPAWLAATYPDADATFLGADCATPPCLIGVGFASRPLSTVQIRALLTGVQAEIERRLGYPMTTVHADQDRTGRDLLWMYALPAELPGDARETLRASAEDRHAALLAPQRAPTPPSRPGPGEPGYVGP